MQEKKDKIFHFGDFSFDPKILNLKRSSDNIPLKRQSAEVLKLLLENDGNTVTREVIRANIWENRTIEFDHGINAAIRDIRQALGDNSKSPQFIGTHSKVGYRFLKPVQTTNRNGFINRLRVLAAIGILAIGSLALGMTTGFNLDTFFGGEKYRIGIMPVTPEEEGQPLAMADKWTSILVQELAEQQNDILVISAGELFGEDRPDPSMADMSKWFEVDFLLSGSLVTNYGKRALRLRLIRTDGYVHIWAKTIEFDGDYHAAFSPFIDEIKEAALEGEKH